MSKFNPSDLDAEVLFDNDIAFEVSLSSCCCCCTASTAETDESDA